LWLILPEKDLYPAVDPGSNFYYSVAMNKTGIVKDDLFISHDPGPYHPEKPERLKEIYAMLERTGLEKKLTKVPARPASETEICRVHDKRHYDKVAQTEGISMALDADTRVSEDSFRAALNAAGGLLELTRGVTEGELTNGFALVRPPGHHAERGAAMGFCLFNNAAVAAEYALAELGCQRVAVVDWDLHHGNGTMHSFYERRDVLYLSTHQYPFYPGSGAIDEIGTGEGRGYTVNVPFSSGMGDEEYASVFRELFQPVLLQYEPDLIIVSAGLDPLSSDPLGSMEMTPRGFADLTSILMNIAEETCRGRLVLTLEGGYDVKGEAEAVEECLRTLLGEDVQRGDGSSEAYVAGVSSAAGRVSDIIEKIKDVQADLWHFEG